MPSLKEIIENNDSSYSRIFNFFIEFLIVISLIGLGIVAIPTGLLTAAFSRSKKNGYQE